MKIYTSYYANIKNLIDCTPVSIAGYAPTWYKGAQYKKLAPKWSFFSVWKENHDNDYYIEHFFDEVINKLDINDVYRDLQKLSNGKDIVLLCYETPEKFCHRHLVAKWLTLGGYETNEYNKNAKETILRT